jgi:biofilm PGA synthesis N-glycosyltransferase PgaC
MTPREIGNAGLLSATAPWKMTSHGGVYHEPVEETMLAKSLTYVIVTPARNEAAYIEKTIESVLTQTILPLKWVIVSDGSTDGTDEIVNKFAAQHDWIELVTLPERAQRNFAGKVLAFNAGRAKLTGLEYDVICNLDADVSFDQEYFSFLLQKLAEDPKLGLVGTPYIDPLNQPYDYRYVSIEHVTGPCQLFRRQCFDDIGGYMAVKGGAIDRIADIATRMKGWKTRTYTDKMYLHHRHTGTAQQGLLMAKFRDGGKDYSVGTSLIWELFRSVYQMTKKPFIVGGVLLGSGYVWSLVRRVERPVSREMVEFCRREQMQRLRALITGRTGAKS